MAIKPEPADGDEEEAAGLTPSPEAMPADAPPAKRRGGGPKTPEGKKRSSSNAIKHGVFSKSPVIGDESDEDWLEHLAGMRESLKPQGRNEELIVYQLALNLWQRLREDRWETETLQRQVEDVNRITRKRFDPEMMDLPEDEAAWWSHSTDDAWEAVDLLRAGDPDAALPLEALESFRFALESGTDIELPLRKLRTSESETLDLNAVTAGQVLAVIDETAKTLGVSQFDLLDAVAQEINRAIMNQAMRDEDDVRRKNIQRTDALVLSDNDSARHDKRVNQLDKEYDRSLKRLELSQRARGDDLPPPIRLHHSEE